MSTVLRNRLYQISILDLQCPFRSDGIGKGGVRIGARLTRMPAVGRNLDDAVKRNAVWTNAVEQPRAFQLRTARMPTRREQHGESAENGKLSWSGHGAHDAYRLAAFRTVKIFSRKVATILRPAQAMLKLRAARANNQWSRHWIAQNGPALSVTRW